MRPRRPLFIGSHVDLVRPLLCARRSDIEEFARQAQLEWREDASNLSVKYRRGAIRTAILPAIEEYFGAGAIDRIIRSAELMRWYLDVLLLPEIERAFGEAAVPEAHALDLSILQAMPEVFRGRVILEALRRWLPDVRASEKVVAEIAALADAQPGRRAAFAKGDVWRNRRHLRFIIPSAAQQSEETHQIELGGSVWIPSGTLSVEAADTPSAGLIGADPHVEYIDRDTVRFPLTVRSWRPGDRFRPLGMNHTRKISDFLTDEKVPSHRRSDVYVVLSDDDIVWVVGLRIAHDVRIRRKTRRAARLTFRADNRT